MENERNCSNCGNYRPNGDYQNNNSSDRGSFAPLIILLLFCALAYFIYQNNQLQDELQTFQDRHNSCISVDKSGNMWFTKGDMSELVTSSNIWDELDKLGADDSEEYSSEIENSSSKQYDNIDNYSGEVDGIDDAKSRMKYKNAMPAALRGKLARAVPRLYHGKQKKEGLTPLAPQK